jgi:hypothetical protein
MVIRLIGKVAGVEMNVKEQKEKKKDMDTGKKEIMVTIREFIENGGELNPDRAIYSMDATDDLAWPVGTYLAWDDKLKCHLAKNRKYKSWPISVENKIAIKVKPVWK